MRRGWVVCGACATALGYASQAIAAPPASDDRFTLMASGSSLTNTNGGWGAAAGWLHDFNADTILGFGAEHQSIGDANWNFGSVNLSHGFGDASSRTTLYAEAHEGSGKDKVHSYEYSIVAVGAYQNLTHQLSLQLEDKQINVDTEDGNLPKLGLQYLWSPTFSTAVAYAYSVSGSLDTRIVSGRFDTYGKTVSFFGGVANGQASPILINENGLPGAPAKILHEYFVGAGHDFSRADTKLVLDYVNLAGSEHWTLTLSCVLHRRHGG